jgi:predicted transcriptional regulator
MKDRQPNQHKILMHEKDLTIGAEELLNLVEKYQYTHNVSNKQYSYLMGISLRNTIKYFTELIEKGYIKVTPENRKNGRGKANKYEIIDNPFE